MAPTDPRFLDITADELRVEYWTWFYSENPNAIVDEDEEFDKDAILADIEANPDDWEVE